MKTRKTASVFAVAILMISASAAIVANDEESDAVFELGTFAAGFALGAVSGGATVYMIDQLLAENKSNLETAWREASADKIQTIVTVTEADAVTALKNYSQIWGYTAEHFQRQAEVAASMSWAPNKAYAPEEILTYSGTYENSSVMLGNAVAQINKVWASLSDSLDVHNADEVYAGKMTFAWTYGNQSFGSPESWSGKSVYVASVPSGSVQKAYVASGGILYKNGVSVETVSEGRIVEMDGGVWASDRMLPVIDSSAAEIHAGMIVSAGSETKTLWYENGRAIVDGTRYDSLSVTVSPAGSESKSAEITDELSNRESLVNAVKSTVAKASSSASAVWRVFSDAGHASAYLSTLAVPNVYENVAVTTEQQSIMTVLALEQLASYWQESGGNLKTSYSVTGGSNLLFIRGDIRDASGTLIAEDAVFTPYYTKSDETVSVGSNVQSQASVCAVWTVGYDGNLSAWTGTAGDQASLIEASAGYVFDIAEIRFDGNDVASADLKIADMDYIDGKEISVEPTPHSDSKSWINGVLMILGIVMAAFGLFTGRGAYLVLGIAALCLGAVGIETVGGWLGWK